MSKDEAVLQDTKSENTTSEMSEANVKETEATETQTEATEVQTEATETQTTEVRETEVTAAKDVVAEKNILLWIIIAVVVVALAVYFGVAIYFQSHFLPNTIVNGYEVDYQAADEVAALLGKQVQGYKLEVSGRIDEIGTQGILGELSAQDIQVAAVDTLATAKHILEQQNAFLWIMPVFANEHYSYDVQQGITFDEELLTDKIKTWEAFQKDNMILPLDAHIGEYSDEMAEYEIISEVQGTQLDMDVVKEQIKNAVLIHNESINLDELGCYKEAKVTAEDEKLKNAVATANRWLKTKVTYDWVGTEVILDKELIHEWISFRGNEAVLDEEAVGQFIAETSQALDTYGKNRKFTTTLGVELTLPSGAFGWKTDREAEQEELVQLIHQGSVLNKEPIYSSKAPNKGSNDIGSSYVEADLTNQHLYLYSNGQLVLETDFVSGRMDLPGCVTPFGVFGLTYKTTNAVLRGADYETPVSFWMPFHGNFGMHDASWRTEFGGDIYLSNGSHGCINLPVDKAGEIYQYVSTGFPVICYYY